MVKADAEGSANDETLQNESPIETAAHAPSFVLVVVGTFGVRVVPLSANSSLDVGRGDGADVKVADARMSRRHVRLHCGETFRLEELRSANGATVRGEKLAPGETREIKPGDPIELGQTMLVVRRFVQPAVSPSESGMQVRADRDPESRSPGEPRSVEMEAILALADRAAQSTIAVLVLGETGVGKDVVAERIHRASARANGRFLRLNCSALAPSLLESELFGHERGAFTGATRSKIGLLESAAGGTVFLDEIGDLALDLQSKLLVVLERHEVLPVGALRPRPIDVRIIAATNRPLSDDVAAETFRADLYYRLNGVTLAIPPLRDRRVEVPGLARLFARDAARSIGRATPELAPDLLEALSEHAWPGNVRELRTVMERAVLLGDAEVLHAADVMLEAAPSRRDPPLPERDSEREAVVDALARTGGNQSRAAVLLGVSRNTLIARIEKYGLARPLAVNRRS